MTRPRVLLLCVAAAAVAGGFGCTASEAASAAAGGERGAVAAETTPPDAEPAKTTDAAASSDRRAEARASAVGHPAGAACDDGPCTLAAWMKANAAPAMIARDFDSLATVLARAETFAPPGYPYWASIAGDGAAAARAQDLEAARAACRSCHAQYKARYKHDLHGRLL